MRRIVGILGSMKITIGLLLVLLVVLAVGTIIESLDGRDAAFAKVYATSWFYLLLGVFGVNLIFSLADRWPWSNNRIGFVMTHCAMVVILFGALATEFFKAEGQIGLWEGQSTEMLVDQSRHNTGAQVPLGFTIRLDDFQIDHYPGTQRPAMFRSLVTTIDPASGEESQHVIEMNRELSWGDFKFFQSSYQMRGDREMSVLSVSRDPGQTIVFIGYTLLVLGMIVVLVTRIRQRRALPNFAFPGAGPIVKANMKPLIVAMALLASAATAQAVTVDGATLKALHTLPVQHDGRVMPLDTLARESVLNVTGHHRWVRQDPVATVLGWTYDSERWADASVVKIGSKDLAVSLGMPGRRHASFNALVEAPNFQVLTDEGRRQANSELPLSPLQEDALELEGRLVTLHGFLTRRAIRPLPVSDDPVDRWSAPANIDSPAKLLAIGQNPATTQRPNYPSAKAMQQEFRYNSVRPTRFSWLILLPATILAFQRWRGNDNPWFGRITSVLLIAGFTVMTWGIGMRWAAAGRIPASNMYESMLFLAWGVGLFSVVATLSLKNRLIIFNAAAMSTLTIMLTDLLPMDSFIHPMPPVLSGTPWLAIHVPIIMVSYALLALSAFVAHMRLGLEIFAPKRLDMASVMDEAHYWYVQIGSIMLVVGILTGSIWAASSWGRYWGWDPKEVWSLVAFLAYMAILHARIDRWIGGAGVAAASIMAFGTILMTYLGVNYVLAAGLHSYGFGGSKIALFLLIGLIVETIYVAVGLVAARRNRPAPAVATLSPPPGSAPKG